MIAIRSYLIECHHLKVEICHLATRKGQLVSWNGIIRRDGELVYENPTAERLASVLVQK